MKQFLFILFILFNINTNAQIYNSKKDSIINNRYNKNKILFGGIIGGGLTITSGKKLFSDYNINNFSEIGFFVKEKTAVILHSFYDYNKYYENTGNNIWDFSSRQSLILRYYFHPKKISFFLQSGIVYDNFFANRTFYNNLPAKWFHVGSVSGGTGINLFVYKFDITVGLIYRHPIIYKTDALKYTDFSMIKGIDYFLGFYFTY